MNCRNGLHPKDYPGECVECRKVRQRSYRDTEKGAESNRRSSRVYHYKMPGLIYQARLLKHRRRRALQARARRRGKIGALPLERRD